MSLNRAPLEQTIIAPHWSDPFAMLIAMLARIFQQIVQLKRVRRTTKFKANWRDHWAGLRQSEWHRDQLLAAGAAELLAGKELTLEDYDLIMDPPDDYGGPCPRTPYEMNRRFLALARWNADPEAAIRKHAQRIAKRAGIDLDNPHAAHGSTDATLRAAAHHELVGLASNSPQALILSRPQRGRPSKDERGYAHARGPPTPFTAKPTPPRTHLRERARLPAARNRPIHQPHDEPRQPHSTYEASHPARAGASFLNDKGRRRIRRRPSSRLASPLTIRRTSGDWTR